ncbi:MAG TPA: ABC transporter permease, partial [Acidobacteriaceae bacterium]|nr:ABC transporter permease [Acidobacteriaceae bacterium]
PIVPGRLNQTQLWVPMSFTPAELEDYGDSFDYGFVARLKSNVSVMQAEQHANRIAREIQSEYPASLNVTLTTSIVPLRQSATQQAQPLIHLLFAAVLIVLLIACANLAGLLLLRAIERRREIAMRLALGARTSTLLRQTMLESLLLSIGGGVFGVCLAAFIMQIWTNFLPETLPRLNEIGLHWGVVAFALATTFGTGILCGLAPAFAAFHVDMNEILKSGGRNGNTSSSHARLRSTLVIGEIATALVLLMAAGLLLRSFQKMRDVDPGFQPEQIVTAQFNLPSQRYQTQTQVDTFEHQLLNRLNRLPGVQSTALTTALPMADATSTRSFTVEGYQQSKNNPPVFEANAYVVGDYFRATQIPLLHGRTFTEADNSANAPLVIVVNHTLARMFFPEGNPVGKRIHWGLPQSNDPAPWMTVIGEVADTKQGSLDTKPWPQAYEPLAQEPAEFDAKDAAAYFQVVGQSMRIVVRTGNNPQAIENSIRKTVWSLDPQLAVSHMQTMERTIHETEAPRRFDSTVLTAFALGAVLLAILGMYAVIAFSVAQRLQEMAIRMVLGAQHRDVIELVLLTGLKLGAIGCILGIFGALAVSQLLRSLLFQVSPFDPKTFAFAIGAVLLLVVAACALPAHRAASIDPIQALRSE